MPSPIDPSSSAPPRPTVAPRARVADLIGNIAPFTIDGWLKDELIHVRPLRQSGERAELGLDLVLQTKISTASVLTPRILESGADEVRATCSWIGFDNFAGQQSTLLKAVHDFLSRRR